MKGKATILQGSVRITDEPKTDREKREAQAWKFLSKKNFKERIAQLDKGNYEGWFFAKFLSEVVCLRGRMPSSNVEQVFANALVDCVKFFDDPHWSKNRYDLVSLEKARLQLMGLAGMALLNVMHIDRMVATGRDLYDFEEIPDRAGSKAKDDPQGSGQDMPDQGDASSGQ